jgi:hypothetical protein
VQKRTEEQQGKAERRLMARQEEKKRKLAEMGIDYDMSAVEYVSNVLLSASNLMTLAEKGKMTTRPLYKYYLQAVTFKSVTLLDIAMYHFTKLEA